MSSDDFEVHEDGTRHLVRGESVIKRKILDTHEEKKARQAELQDIKERRIAHKKATQRRGGWPQDKSPI
jgi:hypothetical protein